MKFLSFSPRSFSVGILLAFSGLLAQAHPGHGLHEASTTHLLTSPHHLVILAGGGAVLLLVARFVQRRLPRHLLQGAGVAALVTATVVWGLHL